MWAQKLHWRAVALWAAGSLESSFHREKATESCRGTWHTFGHTHCPGRGQWLARAPVWSLTSLEVPGHNGKAEHWCMSRDPTATPGPEFRPEKTNMLRASTSPKPHLTFSGEANAHIVLHPVSYLPLTSSTAAFLEHASCPEREGVHQGTGGHRHLLCPGLSALLLFHHSLWAYNKIDPSPEGSFSETFWRQWGGKEKVSFDLSCCSSIESSWNFASAAIAQLRL